MKIVKYNLKHEKDLFAAIGNDPDWEWFIKNKNTYKKYLQNSITFVCCNNIEFCGYIRAIQDIESFVYISELYVLPKWRNNKIGQALIERVKTDYSDFTVYALSDEDDYYHKKGYKKIGSVFEI